MKYYCESCKKTFVHPAKFVIIDPEFQEQVLKLEPGQMLGRATEASGFENRLEVSVCPYCRSREFNELVESETPAAPLEDILQVPFEQVKDYLAKGYVELNRTSAVYAKGVIMIKTKPVPNDADPTEAPQS
jgi:hypothetical protein